MRVPLIFSPPAQSPQNLLLPPLFLQNEGQLALGSDPLIEDTPLYVNAAGLTMAPIYCTSE